MMEKFLLYKNELGDVYVEVLLLEETLWLTQKNIADLLGVAKPTISEHLSNIYSNGELDKKQLFGNSEQFKKKVIERLTEILIFITYVIAVLPAGKAGAAWQSAFYPTPKASALYDKQGFPRNGGLYFVLSNISNLDTTCTVNSKLNVY